jgi:hypothetical protein
MQLIEISVESVSYTWRLSSFALGNIMGLMQASASLSRGLMPPSLFPSYNATSVPLSYGLQSLAPLFTMLGNLMPPIDINL